MWNCIKCKNWSKPVIFISGILFGTAGLKLLGSKDARKTYTSVAAAALRAKDSVMAATTKVQEHAEDILAEAKELNKSKSEPSQEEFISE